MPFCDNREYRYFQPLTAPINAEENGYIVSGYASTFEKYELFEMDDVKYYEQISPDAFRNANMADIILQYNHDGPVFARTSNKTLEVSVDDKGLFVKANLSLTSKAKSLFEDISSKMISKMSFAFVVDKDHYDAETHTRYIDSIRKVYDVSAVSIPANPGTEISVATRSYFDGVIKEEQQELLKREALEKQKKRIEMKLKLSEI